MILILTGITQDLRKMGSSITFQDRRYEIDELLAISLEGFKEDYQREVYLFLEKWRDSAEYLKAQTSGSTGTPKIINLLKADMTSSAFATGSFFKFKEGDKHFNPLPAKYIAGKMMLVRSLEWNTDLHFFQPSANPLKFCTKAFTFGVMTPHQLMEGLQSEFKDNIQNIETLLLGGSPINTTLEHLIANLDTCIYLGYGMTETMSHVALRRVNGKEKSAKYKALEGVTFSQDERDCLVIHTQHLSISKVITNDVVKLINDRAFIWLGRYDNVVNSGGIKLHPEQIEQKISELITREFYLTHEEDDILGQRLVMKIEGPESSEITKKIQENLSKYETPKQIYFIEKFSRTETGKIIRK